ncbi:MAG TPA: hypothetical protein VHK69_05290, partial [Chitinophagaceae bacterium]|nr:hypothetical protein [Chitinophagaceae bacterium]
MFLLTFSVSVSKTDGPQTSFDPENRLFIITLDGFRWQEVFNGADSALIHDTEAVADTSFSKALFWTSGEEERRRRLLPFFWNVVARKGQLHGNRKYNNKVNVSNPYALSYPGYSELLTGSVDMTISGNHRKKNRNRNVLEVLNSTNAYAGKVAAFTSWDVFPYILNEERNGLAINSGLENVEGPRLTPAESMLNSVQSSAIADEGPTRYDELTFIA